MYTTSEHRILRCKNPWHTLEYREIGAQSRADAAGHEPEVLRENGEKGVASPVGVQARRQQQERRSTQQEEIQEVRGPLLAGDPKTRQTRTNLAA